MDSYIIAPAIYLGLHDLVRWQFFPVEFSPGSIFTSAPVIVIVVSLRRQRLNACQIHGIPTELMRLLLLLLHGRIIIFISYEDSNQSQANSEYLHR